MATAAPPPPAPPPPVAAAAAAPESSGRGAGASVWARDRVTEPTPASIFASAGSDIHLFHVLLTCSSQIQQHQLQAVPAVGALVAATLTMRMMLT